MASVLKVDKLDPQSGTALELGTSGDTVTVPSGVTLTTTNATLNLPTTITSTTEVKTNKVSPATGTAFALGDSGDTFTVPAGATIDNLGTATGIWYDDDVIQSNIAVLGFKVATNGSLAKYNLVDQAIDEYEDTSGVDASASTNEVRDASGKYYSGVTGTAGESISATGGAAGSYGVSGGGAGGTGTGGASQGTGGTGSAGTTGDRPAGANGSSGGAGGGGGGSDDMEGGAGGNGDAAYYTGGAGGGGSDHNGAAGAKAAGGTGYKGGGGGGNPPDSAEDGTGEGGDGTTYGAGDAGPTGSRKNNGGGGGAFGGGGGGAADGHGGGGGGGSGAAVITYTNAGAQVEVKFSGTTFTPAAGSTDLVVYCIGGGGGGGAGYSGGGGGGGGVAKSNTFSDGVREVTFTIGAGGAVSGTGTSSGNAGSTTSVTIGGNYVYTNMTLQSVDTSAESEPDSSDMVMLIENAAGTATLNTDIKGYISRDSGTTFTQGTLVDEGSWGTNKKILAFHDLDISGQPSGTSMCYKIETLNQSASIDTRIYATSMGWR